MLLLLFTTSLLQQQASTRLQFSAKKTMLIAQQLYEGIEIGKEDSVGLITYMRTDSFVEISSGRYIFKARGRELLFDGHTRVSGHEMEKDEQILPVLKKDQKLE